MDCLGPGENFPIPERFSCSDRFSEVAGGHFVLGLTVGRTAIRRCEKSMRAGIEWEIVALSYKVNVAYA